MQDVVPVRKDRQAEEHVHAQKQINFVPSIPLARLDKRQVDKSENVKSVVERWIAHFRDVTHLNVES